MSQRSPCPYCGNADFEEENGILVCTSCGRQQEGGLQVADDDADFGTQGKVTRKKVAKLKVKVSKIYRGPRGYRLYLLAWQHVLWRQCHTLVHGSVKVPAELWDVVRDLWTLKMSSIVHRLEDIGGRSTDVETDYATEGHTSDTEDEINSNSGTTTHLQPKLWDSIALVYLGILLLRQPVSLLKLYRMIRTEELPFIRAIRHVPTDISSKLPSEYQLALDTTTIPTQHEMQQAVYKLLQDYHGNFSITTPALSWNILLSEWIQELALPIEVYGAVKTAFGLIGYDFTYQLSSQHAVEYGSARKKRRSPVAMPEAQLMSLILVATKLLFPFDLRTNGKAEASASQTALRIDWPSWLTIHQSHVEPNTSARSQTIRPDKAIETSADDIHELGPEALDQYMDWYQATFTTLEPVLQAKKTDLENRILNMFPLQDRPPTGLAEQSTSQGKPPTAELVSRIQREAVHPTATTHQPQNHDNDNENESAHISPAPKYLIFPKPEILQATNIFFSNNASKNYILYFHERAAQLACLDVKRLLQAVRYTEKRLEAWHDRQRRNAAFGPAETGEAKGGVEMDV